MKLTVDPDVDALYLRLNEADIVDSEQVASGVVLDYDSQDNVVGVEVLHLSKRGGPGGSGKIGIRDSSGTSTRGNGSARNVAALQNQNSLSIPSCQGRSQNLAARS